MNRSFWFLLVIVILSTVGCAQTPVNPTTVLEGTLQSEPTYNTLNFDDFYTNRIAQQASQPVTKPIIILDPGHGGNDGGTCYPQYQDARGAWQCTNPSQLSEAQVNLAIALRMKAILEARGYTVYMLRTGTWGTRGYCPQSDPINPPVNLSLDEVCSNSGKDAKKWARTRRVNAIKRILENEGISERDPANTKGRVLFTQFTLILQT
jgi:N-acetylmuramoyl-L-alanine amidase